VSSNKLIAELGLRLGDVIDGKYRIDGVLGTGGMAIVLAAHHLQLDDRVAIKLLRPSSLDNPELVMRFRREARAAVKIKGEHAARVIDVGQLHGTPFMVMEYLHGADLSQWLRRSKRLPVEQAIEFILQTSEALAEAHALGIVHRDLKPANLFVTRRPDRSLCVKVLDFGISKRGPGLASSNITQVSALMGSPLYMSPEQIESSKDTDPRSDIWSLGVILYELLSGEPPFNGETMPELIRQIMSASPKPLRALRPDLPASLETVVLKCLQKERGERFESVALFAQALSSFASARPRTSAQRVSAIMAAGKLRKPEPPPQRTADGGRTALRFWPHATTIASRRALRYGMGTAAVLAAAALLWVQYQTLAPPVAAPAATTETELLPSLAPGEGNTQPAPADVPAGVRADVPADNVGGGETAVPPASPGMRDLAKAQPSTRRSQTRNDPREARARGSAPREAPIAATTSRAPSHAPTSAAPALVPPAAEPEPATRERDASVSNAGDDLRSVKKPVRRGLDLDDPFR
jgi:serine/threonine-protein kinase